MTARARWLFGAHRGANAFVRHFSATTSTDRPSLPWQVVDPVPGRAAAFLRQWSPSGAPGENAIEAHAIEILDRVGSDDEVVVAVDTVQAMREAILHTRHVARVSAQIVGRSPGLRGACFGLAMTLEREDVRGHEQANLLLTALEGVSADRTSSRVLMESGDALAPALLIPLRERVAALTAASTSDHERHYALTFVLANGDFPMVVVPGPTETSLAAREQVAIGLTASLPRATRTAVAFASVELSVDILLLNRTGGSAPAVVGLHTFAAGDRDMPQTTFSD